MQESSAQLFSRISRLAPACSSDTSQVSETGQRTYREKQRCVTATLSGSVLPQQSTQKPMAQLRLLRTSSISPACLFALQTVSPSRTVYPATSLSVFDAQLRLALGAPKQTFSNLGLTLITHHPDQLGTSRTRAAGGPAVGNALDGHADCRENDIAGEEVFPL